MPVTVLRIASKARKSQTLPDEPVDHEGEDQTLDHTVPADLREIHEVIEWSEAVHDDTSPNR